MARSSGCGSTLAGDGAGGGGGVQRSAALPTGGTTAGAGGTVGPAAGASGTAPTRLVRVAGGAGALGEAGERWGSPLPRVTRADGTDSTSATVVRPGAFAKDPSAIGRSIGEGWREASGDSVGTGGFTGSSLVTTYDSWAVSRSWRAKGRVGGEWRVCKRLRTAVHLFGGSYRLTERAMGFLDRNTV